MEEKLAVDIFVKHTTTDLNEFKKIMQRTKMMIMKDIQLDERFHPKKYVRYYLTVKILKLPEQEPIDPEFDITHERIERIHNAALTLDILEMKLHSLKHTETELFCHLEMGGIYVLNEGEEANDQVWYPL